jgi:hypothetical protein
VTVSFATDTITVIRAAYVVERGNQVPDWSAATEHAVTGCRVQPMAGEEVLTGRDAVVNRRKLFAPATADITALDRVRFGGVTYEVESPILPWRSPTSLLAHVETTLKRVEG